MMDNNNIGLVKLPDTLELNEGSRRDMNAFLESQPPVSLPHRIGQTVDGHGYLVWFDYKDDRRTVALRFRGNGKIIYEIKQPTMPDYDVSGMMARLAGRASLSDHEQRLSARSKRFEQFLAGDLLLAVGHCEIGMLHELLNDVGIEGVVYRTRPASVGDVVHELRSAGMVDPAHRLQMLDYESGTPTQPALHSESLRLMADVFLAAPDVATCSIVNLKGALGVTYMVEVDATDPGVLSVIFRADGRVQWAASQELQHKHGPEGPGLHVTPGRPVIDVAKRIRAYLEPD